MPCTYIVELVIKTRRIWFAKSFRHLKKPPMFDAVSQRIMVYIARKPAFNREDLEHS